MVEPVKGRTGEHAQRRWQVKDTALEAIDELKGVAAESSHAVTGTAPAVVLNTKDTGTEAADAVKSETTGASPPGAPGPS